MITKEYSVEEQLKLTVKDLGDVLETLIPVTLDLAKLKGALTGEIDDNISSLLIPEVDDELEDEDIETKDDLLLERMSEFSVNSKNVERIKPIPGMFDSVNSIHNLRSALDKYDIAKKETEKYVKVYLPPSEDEKRLLIKDVIEGLSYSANFLSIVLSLLDNNGVYGVVMESLEKLNIPLDEFKRIVEFYCNKIIIVHTGETYDIERFKDVYTNC